MEKWHFRREMQFEYLVELIPDLFRENRRIQNILASPLTIPPSSVLNFPHSLLVFTNI